VPEPKREIAVGGPLLERVKRRAMLLFIQLVRLPYRVLTLPLRELRGEVASLRAAAVESIAYVGVELRRLGDLVEQGGSSKAAPVDEAEAVGAATSVVEVPFAFRSLAGVDSPAPVLVVGSRGRQVGVSLTSLGYDVTQVNGPLDDWDAADRRFQAVLYMGDTVQPEPEELQQIGDLLSDDGILVVGVAFGFGANGSPAAFDEDSLDDLLAGWTVADRIVVASRPDRAWAPVRNGATPDRGVALVAARRAASAG
jgi:hypothetical protein